MTKYYIYHIPTFVHKNGKIGKIGCTELEAQERVSQQGYTEYEILETHTDIMIASDRELELQKEYGYPVDTRPYYKTRQMPTQEGCKKGGQTQGPIQGKINVQSGHLDKIRTKESCIKGGIIGGPIAGNKCKELGIGYMNKENQSKGGLKNVESGHLKSISSKGGKTCVAMGFLDEARKIAIEKTSKPVLVYKIDGTFIGEYESRNECARKLDLHPAAINRVCNGKQKQTEGYIIKKKPTAI
jgi:hypothetical protein